MVEIYEKDMVTEIQIMKGKVEKNLKSLVTNLLELILIKQISIIMKNLVEQVLALLNQLKSKPKN